MTKEKNPQNQRTGISLFLGKRKPRASHIPTARLLLLHSLHRPAKQQNHDGATRYLPDLPTDSSEEAKEKARLSKVLSNHAVANTWWDPSSQPSWLTEECYVQRIQPLLKAKKVREIAEAIQVSELYAGLIRSGRRRPHPRHWEVLARWVGVSG